MNRQNFIKVVAVICSILLVVSLGLVAFGIMSWQFFWLIALVCAGIAWWVIPARAKPRIEE